MFVNVPLEIFTFFKSMSQNCYCHTFSFYVMSSCYTKMLQFSFSETVIEVKLQQQILYKHVNIIGNSNDPFKASVGAITLIRVDKIPRVQSEI